MKGGIPMDQSKIGQFLKQLRKEKGITQEEFAEKIGVSGRTVSRWETGSNMPDISLLVDIADFYDVDVREIIEGERKSGMMNEDIRETAEKMAVYADAEKSRVLKLAQVFGIIGVIALSAATISACVNYEPAVGSFISLILSFIALVSMVVMTLYVTGVLSRIAKNRSVMIAVAVIMGFACFSVLKRVMVVGSVFAVMYMEQQKPAIRTEGIDNYDKAYLAEEFSADMTTNFFLFPDDLDNAEEADFCYEYKTGLFDTEGSFFLTAVYSDEEYAREEERLSGITCTVNDGRADHTQAVKYDETMYRYPAYIAIDGYADDYEYALMDADNNRIIYVVLGYPDPEELSEYSDYLKTGPGAYDTEDENTLERFCIYAVKGADFDGYAEY